jgi:hypothetical protein
MSTLDKTREELDAPSRRPRWRLATDIAGVVTAVAIAAGAVVQLLQQLI